MGSIHWRFLTRNSNSRDISFCSRSILMKMITVIPLRQLYSITFTHWRWIMMTSSNGNIFRVTGHLCGEFTGPRWIPHKGQWRGALMFSLICVWINDWVNNREAGDLRRYRAHYDVILMINSKKTVTVLLMAVKSHESGSTDQSHKSHNAPLRTEMCTFLFWMVYCGVWERCIVGFVSLVFTHAV